MMATMPGKSPCCGAQWWIRQMHGIRLVRDDGKYDARCSNCRTYYVISKAGSVTNTHLHTLHRTTCEGCHKRVCSECVHTVRTFDVRREDGKVIQLVHWYHKGCTVEERMLDAAGVKDDTKPILKELT